jgi:hypothetical protein
MFSQAVPPRPSGKYRLKKEGKVFGSGEGRWIGMRSGARREVE